MSKIAVEGLLGAASIVYLAGLLQYFRPLKDENGNAVDLGTKAGNDANTKKINWAGYAFYLSFFFIILALGTGLKYKTDNGGVTVNDGMRAVIVMICLALLFYIKSKESGMNILVRGGIVLISILTTYQVVLD